MVTIVASVIIFGLLIFAHELGHFLAARRVGIGVHEFAIGFGPRLVSRQAGDTTYSLRIFPLGGFVRLKGEDPDEMHEDNSFQRKPVWKRFAVIASGPLMNFALAVLLFAVIYFFYLGVPVYRSTAIGELLPGGRAEAAGMQAGDRILSINGAAVKNWPALVELINANPEREILIEFERNGRVQSVTVAPRRDPQTGVGLIGISPESRKFAVFPSLRAGLTHTTWFIRFLGTSIVQMVTGRAAPDVVGPLGIIQIVGEVARTGLFNLVSLAAIISINLGLINLLPIPALDGSRLMFLAAEAVRGRPVDPHKESFIHFIGFTVLILLMILIAYRDLVRLEILF